jgi:hypothetical protein
MINRRGKRGKKNRPPCRQGAMIKKSEKAFIV